MLTPQHYRTLCPECQHPIPLSTAAHLQARYLGVSCHCHSCKHDWIYLDEEPTASRATPSVETDAQVAAHSTEMEILRAARTLASDVDQRISTQASQARVDAEAAESDPAELRLYSPPSE